MTDSATAPTSQIILLGTGTSTGVPMVGCRCPVCLSDDPRNHRSRTGVLVQTGQGNFLIDTPPELRLQLIREKIPLVEAALFTHEHADHTFGLDDLRLFGYYLDRAIPLYCETRVQDRLKQAFEYAFQEPPAWLHAGATPRFELRTIDESPFDLMGVTIHPIRLLHGRLPIFGYRIGNWAFCTDVSEIPADSWRLLEGLDTLVIGALRDKPHPTHFSIGQALEVVERVRPRQTYLTHLSHLLDYQTTNARLPAGVELAYDGLRIPLTPPV
jgi:phosphoribosyl 1,2-cyclic phosphate phosphodiesterase